MKTNEPVVIAIAEDSPLQRELLRYQAKMNDSFVVSISACNGADLLRQLAASEEEPHVCILDLHMPILDGIRTAKIIKVKYPELKLFGFTSSVELGKIEDFSNLVLKVFKKGDNKIYDHILNFLKSNSS